MTNQKYKCIQCKPTQKITNDKLEMSKTIFLDAVRSDCACRLRGVIVF